MNSLVLWLKVGGEDNDKIANENYTDVKCSNREK